MSHQFKQFITRTISLFDYFEFSLLTVYKLIHCMLTQCYYLSTCYYKQVNLNFVKGSTGTVRSNVVNF